jgi:hypothetical protein
MPCPSEDDHSRHAHDVFRLAQQYATDTHDGGIAFGKFRCYRLARLAAPKNGLGRLPGHDRPRDECAEQRTRLR